MLTVCRYRTQAPLSFPPHVMTLAAIYTSALLSLNGTDRPSSDTQSTPSSNDEHVELSSLVNQLGNDGPWQAIYSASVDSVDG